MKYKLKEHVTNEMLLEWGFYKTPRGHWRFDVNENNHVIIDKNTRETKEVRFDFKLLKLVDIETNRIQNLIDLGYVEVVE